MRPHGGTSALVLALLALTAAAGAAQYDARACALIPPEEEPLPSEPNFQIVSACVASYTGLSGVLVYMFDEAETPRRAVANAAQAAGAFPVDGIGEAATQYPGGGEGLFANASLSFVRGCYFVQGSWNAENEARVRATLARIDANILAANAPCGSASLPLPPPSGGDAMALGLACDPTGLQEGGRLTCVAAVSNAPSDAQFVYAWTLDGAGRPETGTELVAEFLAPGAHTVTASARDAATGAEVPAQSVTVTRGAAALPGGGGSSSAPPPLGNLPLPVVAGGAIAIALAVGGLIRRTRGRPRPPASPTAPPRAPPIGPAEAAGRVRPRGGPETPSARPRPPAGPEALRPPTAPARPPRGPESISADRREPDRQRPPPTLRARLVVQPSVLSARLHDASAAGILGDGVDFLFAGFVLEVGPPGEWEVDRDAPGAVTAAWTVQGGIAQFVDEFTGLRDRIDTLHRTEPLRVRSDQHNVAIRTHWRDQDDELRARVQLLVRVRSADGTEAWPVPVEFTTAFEAVPVRGANPSSWLTANSARRLRLGLPPETQIAAYADGSDEVYVQPGLDLFGQTYAGGLALDPGGEGSAFSPDGGPRLQLSDFFEVRPDTPHRTVDGRGYPDARLLAKQPQALVLCARFRFADRLLRRVGEQGVPVRLAFHPTGDAAGLEGLDPFGYLLAEHYRACRTRYESGGIPPADPVFIRLKPSTLEVVDPGLREHGLPLPAGAGAPAFDAQLRIRVCSASGDPVPGSRIRPNRPSSPASGDVLTAIADWRLAFRYDPPEHPHLRRWEEMYAPRREHVLEVTKVDEEGRPAFRGQEGPPGTYRYDHWKEFFQEEPRYLLGQCCTMHLLFRADGEEVEVLRFPVGPCCKLYLYVDYTKGGGLGHVFAGLIDERGREIRTGFYLYYTLEGVKRDDLRIKGAGMTAAAGGMLIAGEAALILASLVPGIGQVGMVLRLARYAGWAAGAGAGFTAGVAAASLGIGKLLDDGNSKTAPGKWAGVAFARYDVCRGWDLTRAQYEQVLDRMKEWKRRSDLNQLIYDLTAEQIGPRVPFSGNCVSFAADLLAAAGIQFSLPPDAYVKRPGNYGPLVANDPRGETHPTPDGTALTPHCWCYPQGTTLLLDAALGRTDPPAEPAAGVPAVVDG